MLTMCSKKLLLRSWWALGLQGPSCFGKQGFCNSSHATVEIKIFWCFHLNVLVFQFLCGSPSNTELAREAGGKRLKIRHACGYVCVCVLQPNKLKGMGMASREPPSTRLSAQLRDIQHHPTLLVTEYFMLWLQTLHLYSVSLFRHIYYKRAVSGNSPREDLPGWLWIFYSQIAESKPAFGVGQQRTGKKQVINRLLKNK